MSLNTWSLKNTPELNEQQFKLWCGLLEERTGMMLPEQRKTFLETSLTMRMRELGVPDYDEYYVMLNTGLAGSVEWATLVDRLTVHETRFYRHSDSYDLVRDYTLNRLSKSGEHLSFDVWSVGCSTGEEPYSLAILLDELIAPDRTENFFGITATDISLAALSKGRQGIYFTRQLDELDSAVKIRHFSKLDDRRYQVKAHLRRRVCFAQVNVMQLAKAPMRNMDLIFCQNLLIYFSRHVQREIVTHLVERLAPGGLLVLGVGEVVDFRHPLARRIDDANTLAFKRIDSVCGSEHGQ